MRTVVLLGATALVMSTPAAALAQDVTGSIRETSALDNIEGSRSPRFPSLPPELLVLVSERFLPTPIGPYMLVQARRTEANAIPGLVLSPQLLGDFTAFDRTEGSVARR
jgi:hypothetical protein